MLCFCTSMTIEGFILFCFRVQCFLWVHLICYLEHLHSSGECWPGMIEGFVGSNQIPRFVLQSLQVLTVLIRELKRLDIAVAGIQET